MNRYLLAEANRDAIRAHNINLIKSVQTTIGTSTYEDHDFNNPEEFKVLRDALVSASDPETLTVTDLTTVVYGTDDDLLKRRVRSNLSYNSRFQKTLTNGTAFVARKDGTLLVTGTPDEYGDLVEEDAARKTAALAKTVRQRTERINKDLDTAVDKVPSLGGRVTGLRGEVTTTLGSLFSRQLALLGGDD